MTEPNPALVRARTLLAAARVYEEVHPAGEDGTFFIIDEIRIATYVETASKIIQRLKTQVAGLEAEILRLKTLAHGPNKAASEQIQIVDCLAASAELGAE